jgi:hypothetical protein
MKTTHRYVPEQAFVAGVILLSLFGFSGIYFGPEAPTAHQHLHVVTSLAWLSLLLWQLRLVATGRHGSHRKLGLSILVMGPLLVATTALLSVHSAHKGVVTGEGDFLIVQNVKGTLELGAIILVAFVLRRRRKLHGAFLLGTAMLFMGIALFFTLIGFVPAFRIEGPETFHRFGTAAATARYACLGVGLLFFLRDWRNGWPLLLVASFFSLNEWINASLAERELLQPLTAFVGSMSQPVTFMGAFAMLFAVLAATGILNAPARQPGPPVKQAA